MAEWLQYMTSDKPTALTAERARNGHPGPWKVAYFAVGNETWGCGGNMRPEYYADLFRRYATFVKDHAPESVELVASGAHDDDYHWTDVVMARAGDLLDCLPPAGAFTPKTLDEDFLLFAGGSGITPVLSILKSALAGGEGKVVLVYANQHENAVIFADVLRKLAADYPQRLHVIHWL